MSIEKSARKYFEQGYTARETHKILLAKGIKCSENTIKHYRIAYNKGFSSSGEYAKHLVNKKGFKSEYNRHKYIKEFEDFKKHSEIFKDFEEYKIYMGDWDFEVIYRNIENCIDPENPFMATLRQDLEFMIERPEDEEYIRRGIEILKELGKIY